MEPGRTFLVDAIPFGFLILQQNALSYFQLRLWQMPFGVAYPAWPRRLPVLVALVHFSPLTRLPFSACPFNQTDLQLTVVNNKASAKSRADA